MTDANHDNGGDVCITYGAELLYIALLTILSSGISNNISEPIIGLYTSDDKRNNYFLDNNENNYIYCHDIMEKNNLYFISTDLRIESVRRCPYLRKSILPAINFLPPLHHHGRRAHARRWIQSAQPCRHGPAQSGCDIHFLSVMSGNEVLMPGYTEVNPHLLKLLVSIWRSLMFSHIPCWPCSR